MKSISLFILLTAFILTANGQHQDVTVNTLTTYLSKHYLISYEYIFASDRSLGLQVGFGKTDDIFLNDYAITPYYRYYYGEDANLFFIETFIKGAYYKTQFTEEHTTVGIGVGLGWKFKIVQHFLIGLNIGVGYNFTKTPVEILAKRGSLFIGYRL